MLKICIKRETIEFSCGEWTNASIFVFTNVVFWYYVTDWASRDLKNYFKIISKFILSLWLLVFFRCNSFQTSLDQNFGLIYGSASLFIQNYKIQSLAEPYLVHFLCFITLLTLNTWLGVKLDPGLKLFSAIFLINYNRLVEKL